jgi:hypothetical protein
MPNDAAQFVTALLTSIFVQHPTQVLPSPPQFGWAEEALLWPEKIALKVKLDSASSVSLFDARGLVFFNKQNQRWVRFTVDLKDNNTGQPVHQQFERKILKPVGPGVTDATLNPAVQMDICLGGTVYKEVFVLADRHQLHYPIVVGRSLLKKLGPVSASRSFTVEPRCKR